MSPELFQDYIIFVPGVTQETFSSDLLQDVIKLLGRVAITILSNIHNGALPRK